MTQIKIKNNRAYRHSRIQNRWFPIAMNEALEMIRNNKALVVGQ